MTTACVCEGHERLCEYTGLPVPNFLRCATCEAMGYADPCPTMFCTCMPVYHRMHDPVGNESPTVEMEAVL